MDAVSGFEHGAPARKGTISVNKLELLAKVARGSRIEARHLAGILLALDEGDDIVAGWNKGISIFESAANTNAIDSKVTVSVLTTCERSCQN